MRTVVLLLALLVSAPAAAAQGDGAAVPGTSTRDPNGDPTAAPPVSIERIQRGLRQAPPAISQSDLKYFVQVYGQSPKIELFTKQDQLQRGPAPYGAPTHAEFRQLWTPQEFRAPVMDLNAFLMWLMQQVEKKKPEEAEPPR